MNRKNKIISNLAMICFIVAMSGCNYVHYHLKGHKGSNMMNPPDITMRVGEEKEVTSYTFFHNFSIFGSIVLPSVQSEGPDIVEVYWPDNEMRNAIKAVRPGKARLYYSLGADKLDPENKGFWPALGNLIQDE